MVIYPLASSFSYDRHTENYKGAPWIVKNVVDAVAKGGNFQIGVGPDGSGKFHPEAVSQLKEGGRWLQVNGKAIYSKRTRAAALWCEGDNLRFSRSKDNRFVYAFAMNWPEQELAIRTVRPKSGSSIRLLGFAKPLAWREDANRGLVISLPSVLQDPARRPCQFAWAFEIEGQDRT